MGSIPYSRQSHAPPAGPPFPPLEFVDFGMNTLIMWHTVMKTLARVHENREMAMILLIQGNSPTKTMTANGSVEFDV